MNRTINRILFGILFAIVGCDDQNTNISDEELSPISNEVKGDFNGDGIKETAKVVLLQKGNGNPQENGVSDSYSIIFSDPNIQVIDIGCCEAILINEGNLINERRDVLSVFQAPENGNTHTLRTYSLKGNKWIQIIQPSLYSNGGAPLPDSILHSLILKAESGMILVQEQDMNDNSGRIKLIGKSKPPIIFKPDESSLVEFEDELRLSDLQYHVFTISEQKRLNNDCEVILECDCCSGELLFLKKHFYHIEYCTGSNTLLFGAYTIENNKLKLSYSNKASVWEQYGDDWSDPNNPPLKVFTKDVSGSHSISQPFDCNSKLILIEDGSTEMIASSEKDASEFLTELNEYGLLDSLKAVSKVYHQIKEEFDLEIIDPLPESIDGCGDYYSLLDSEHSLNNLVFVTDLVSIGYVKINGELISLFKDNHKEIQNSDDSSSVEIYRNDEIMVEFRATLIENYDEGGFHEGSIKIIYKNGSKTFKIHGESGC